MALQTLEDKTIVSQESRLPEHRLNEFLAETEYCDYTNPDIKKLSSELTFDLKSEREKALKLFMWVRDNTAYRVGYWTEKASETLKKRCGTCTNNANLLVALLRVVGIPAGYGVMKVYGPDYFGPMLLPRLSQKISKKSTHVYCSVFLNKKWVNCDPSDDEPLSVNTRHLNPQSKLVEWNGVDHAIMALNPSHIISDTYPLPSIDDIIRKKLRFSKYIPAYFGNLYIEFLREQGATIHSLEHLEPGFLLWMKTESPLAYVLYRSYFRIQDVVYKFRPEKDHKRSTF
jgi:hypothetical protein